MNFFKQPWFITIIIVVVVFAGALILAHFIFSYTWLQINGFIFISMFEIPTNYAPSVLYVFDKAEKAPSLASIIAPAAAIGAVIFYSLQARAQTKHASVANNEHIHSRFVRAIQDMANSKNQVILDYTFNEITDIGIEYPDQFQINAANALGQMLFQNNIKLNKASLDETKSFEFTEYFNINWKILMATASLYNKSNISKTKDHFPWLGTVGNLKIACLHISHPDEPAKHVLNKLCFENFLFTNCDLNGLSFEKSNFYGTTFCEVRNTTFSNCLFKFENYRPNMFENVSFDNCYIWESYLTDKINWSVEFMNLIENEIADGNIKVIKKNQLKSWLRKSKSNRMQNWNKFSLV